MGSISNLRLGQCDITYNNVPIGHTKGGVEITIKNDVTEVTVDKYGSTPVRAFHKGTRIEIKTTLSEYEFTQMEQVINAATKSGSILKIGKIAGTELDGAELLLHPSNAGDTSTDVTVFKAIIIGDTKIPFQVDQETVYDVTWLALVSLDDADEDGNGFLIQFGVPSEE